MNRLLKIQLAAIFVLILIASNVVSAQDDTTSSADANARRAEYQQNVDQKRQEFQAKLQVRSEERSVRMAELSAQARTRIQTATANIQARLKDFTLKLSENIAELEANIAAVGEEIDTSEAQQLLIDAKIAVIQAEQQADAAYNAMYAAADGYVDPTAVGAMYTTTKNTALEAKSLVSAAIKAYKQALVDAVDASGINTEE